MLTELSDNSDPKCRKRTKKCFQSKLLTSMKKTRSDQVTVPPPQWFSQFTELAAKERRELLRQFSYQSAFCEICQKRVTRMYLHYTERHSQFKTVIQCLEPNCSKLINHRKGDLFRHMKVIHGWNSQKSADTFQMRGQRFSIPRHVWVEYKNGNVSAFVESGKSSYKDVTPTERDGIVYREDVDLGNTADDLCCDLSASEKTENSQCEEAVNTELKNAVMLETVTSSETVAGFTGVCRSTERWFVEQSLASRELQMSGVGASNGLTARTLNSDIPHDDNVMCNHDASEELKLQAHCEFVRKLFLDCREFDWTNATGPELLHAVMTLELDLHQMKKIANAWMEKIESTHTSLSFARSLLSTKFPELTKY